MSDVWLIFCAEIQLAQKDAGNPDFLCKAGMTLDFEHAPSVAEGDEDGSVLMIRAHSQLGVQWTISIHSTASADRRRVISLSAVTIPDGERATPLACSIRAVHVLHVLNR